jgi:hypothetical protein
VYRGPGSGQPSGSGQSSGSAAANPGGGVIGPEDYGGWSSSSSEDNYKGFKSYKELYAAAASQEAAQEAARSGHGSEANSADKGKGVDRGKEKKN